MKKNNAEESIRASHRRPVIKRPWFRVAAAILIAGIMATAVYLYFTSSPRKSGRTAPHPISAIRPGHNGAILTLEDGKTIVLDSTSKGPLPIQNGTKLLLRKGQLMYKVINKKSTTRAYNTITTTRGRQFRITLPDSSQVWLNAASSIIYPVAFTGKEREVYVTGEVYFEVAPGKIPFKVTKGNVEIQTLGTRFNVNAYEDEPDMKVTLLEGTVQVLPMVNGEWSLLKPGQQALITSNNKLQITDNTNMGQVIAWKNDIFNFQDATLEQVMRQLARWYDIEVRYGQGIPNIIFKDTMSRQNKLAEVLHSLEGSGVHFRLEADRRLTVLP